MEQEHTNSDLMDYQLQFHLALHDIPPVFLSTLTRFFVDMVVQICVFEQL